MESETYSGPSQTLMIELFLFFFAKIVKGSEYIICYLRYNIENKIKLLLPLSINSWSFALAFHP